MKAKTLAIMAVTAALLLGAYWYWSPLLALREIQSAAKGGDPDAFNDRVDYPKLRESLKGQLSAMFTDNLAAQPASDTEFAKAGAALGTMLGLAMMDTMVDAFVRPEVAMRAMQEGRMLPEKTSGEPAQEQPLQAAEAVVWTSERKGVDEYVAFVSKPGESPESRVGLVLERTGFANWKLTQVRLPVLK